jgi:hypothetical protein
LLAIVVLGWNWVPPGASIRQRIGRVLAALGVTAVVLEMVSLVSGIGWGWTRTLGTANQITTGVTPLSAVAHTVSGLADLVGIPLTFAAAKTVFDGAGLLCAALICLWLLWRSPKLGTVQASGLMLLVVALLGPILWAWYLTWGVVVLAAVAAGRLRKGLVLIAVIWTFVGTSGANRIARAVWDAGLPADALLLAGLVGLLLVPLGLGPSRQSVGAPDLAPLVDEGLDEGVPVGDRLVPSPLACEPLDEATLSLELESGTLEELERLEPASSHSVPNERSLLDPMRVTLGAPEPVPVDGSPDLGSDPDGSWTANQLA